MTNHDNYLTRIVNDLSDQLDDVIDEHEFGDVDLRLLTHDPDDIIFFDDGSYGFLPY